MLTEQARMVANLYESSNSELWKMCYPRAYAGTGQYESPRYVATILASSIDWAVYRTFGEPPLTMRHVALAATKAFQYNLPAFFVDKSFLIAASQTSLAEDVLWTDAKLPFEAGLLYLPPKGFLDPEGDSVMVLGWARVRKNEELFLYPKVLVNSPEDSFVVFAFCGAETERMYSYAVRADACPYIKWNSQNTKPLSMFDMPITKDDEQFLQQMVALTFSLLLAQASRPTLTTRGEKQKSKKPQKREIWTPTYLGRGYQIRKETINIKERTTRNKPERIKGHFTHQPIGNFKDSGFISITSLPKKENGTTDWLAVNQETRNKFWKNHEHMWIEPVFFV